jgi:predicted nucleic acid-binding protein
MPRTAIVDTSPLYYLHQVNHLELLRLVYDRVVVPVAVQTELDKGRRSGYDTPDVGGIAWIHIELSPSRLVPSDEYLGAGESEAIALGLHIPESVLIVDDKLGREVAEGRELRVTGTLGVLVRAKRSGHIASVGTIIDAMRDQGMRLSDQVVLRALRLADES